MTDLLKHAQGLLASQPFSVLIGTEIVRYGDGKVQMQLCISDSITQQHGFVHGGVLAYLADNAMTFAAGQAMGGGVVTSEIKINYIKPAIGQMLIARAWTLNSGRRQGVSRCDVFTVAEGTERLCAAAQGTITKLPYDPEIGKTP